MGAGEAAYSLDGAGGGCDYNVGDATAPHHPLQGRACKQLSTKRMHMNLNHGDIAIHTVIRVEGHPEKVTRIAGHPAGDHGFSATSHAI